MAAYIIYKPDLAAAKFAKNRENLQKKRMGQDTKRGGKLPVRRPYQTIHLKDETFAVLSVIGMDNQPIPLMSPMGYNHEDEDASFGVDEYTDFVLNGVTDQRAEKQQIVDTFGDFYVFFYGEQPRILTFSGMMINTKDFNWRSQFWWNYDNFFRGTKLVQMNARAYLSWDTIVVEGYPLQAMAREDATNPLAVQFEMSMLLTNYYDYSNIGAVEHSPVTVAPNETYLNGALRRTKNVVLDNTYDDDAAFWPDLEIRRSDLGVTSTYREGPDEVGQLQKADWLSRLGMDEATYNLLIGVESSLPGLVSGQVQDPNKIKSQIFWNNLKLQSNVRWQLSRTMGAIRDRVTEGVQMLPIQAAYGAMHNVFSQAGGITDDLAKQASIGTRAFGMFASRTFPIGANAASFAADPLGVTRALMGMDIPTADSLTASPSRTVSFHKARVSTSALVAAAKVRTAAESGQIEGFIGAAAKTSFSATTMQLQELIEAGQTVSLPLGHAYAAYPYRAVVEGDQPRYDRVYGDRDYAGAVEEVGALGRTLEESYGDVDNAIPARKATFESDIDPYSSTYTQTADQRRQATRADVVPSSLDEVYRTGVSSSYARSPEEILNLLREAQADIRMQTEVDTSGIRGIDDAVIEPVV